MRSLIITRTNRHTHRHSPFIRWLFNVNRRKARSENKERVPLWSREFHLTHRYKRACRLLPAGRIRNIKIILRGSNINIAFLYVGALRCFVITSGYTSLHLLNKAEIRNGTRIASYLCIEIKEILKYLFLIRSYLI